MKKGLIFLVLGAIATIVAAIFGTKKLNEMRGKELDETIAMAEGLILQMREEDRLYREIQERNNRELRIFEEVMRNKRLMEKLKMELDAMGYCPNGLNPMEIDVKIDEESFSVE